MSSKSQYEPYYLIKRKNCKGKSQYYARFIDQKTAKTIKERDSEETSKGAAGRAAELELEKIQEQIKEAATPGPLAEGFLDWDSTYARDRRARGKSISHGTLDAAESNTRLHIVPRWGDIKVTDMTSAETENWILGLPVEKNLASATVNKILQNLRTILDTAIEELHY